MEGGIDEKSLGINSLNEAQRQNRKSLSERFVKKEYPFLNLEKFNERGGTFWLFI